MKYLTGIHALNTTCNLNTFGDWHSTAIQWEHPHENESTNSLWGDYGIETDRTIPFCKGVHNVANHIRACLDMLLFRQFSLLQGMRKDFIGVEEYDNLIFDKVSKLKKMSYWNEVDAFMEKEYLMKWVNYRKRNDL